MNLLFDVYPTFPQGFQYYADFISEEEELGLITLLKGFPLHYFNFQGFEAKRKVASFGFDYSFDRRNLSAGVPIPDAFKGLIENVADRMMISADAFKELLLTEYPPGSVINWHRDAPPFDVIAGISLLSDCVFRLRPYDKAKQSRNSVISFPVRRRSLYCIEGIARSEWEHSISPVKDKRYSITVRTLKEYK